MEETVAGVAVEVSSFPTGGCSLVVFGGEDVCGDEPPNSLLKKPEMYSIILKMNWVWLKNPRHKTLVNAMLLRQHLLHEAEVFQL